MRDVILAKVIEFYETSSDGLLSLDDGSTLLFSYFQGESVLSNEGDNVRFSGKHCQGAGFSLKPPVSGDLLVLKSHQLYPTWAYLRSWECAQDYDVL